MHNFQGRLKEARERLGLSQQALAQRLDISLRSQQNYEAGTRQPDAAYLTALAAAGADVLYILTGQPSEETDTNAGFDGELLAQVVEGVELLLKKKGKVLSPTKKAQVIVMLYRSFSADNQVDADTISQMIELAA